MNIYFHRSVKLEVHLILKKFSIFMVTYLPTILMNIINQATVYLPGESRHSAALESSEIHIETL